MEDLYKTQGPLGAQFTPENPDLNIVSEVIEANGVPGKEAMDSINLAEVMHFSDWGGLDIAMEAMGSSLEMPGPPVRAVVRFMNKADGKVLHVVSINQGINFSAPENPSLPPDLAAVVRGLLRYSWKDIAFNYLDLTSRERELLTEDQFKALLVWINE